MTAANKTQDGSQAWIKVWLVDLDDTAAALQAREAAHPALSPSEHTRLDAITNPIEQARRRTAYIAQRLILIHIFGPGLHQADLPRDALGRPHLPLGHTGSISLAHTGTHALIAVSNAPRIGVDLEAPRTIRMSPARRALIESAAAQLSPDELPTNGDARFLQAWTRLEALAKADGHGIGHLLTAIGAVGGGPSTPQAASALAASHALIVQDLSFKHLPLGPSLFAALATVDTVRPAVIGGIDQLLDP